MVVHGIGFYTVKRTKKKKTNTKKPFKRTQPTLE